MTLSILLAKKRISRQLFRVCRLNHLGSSREIEAYFREHRSFEKLDYCTPEDVQELEELIKANLIRLELDLELPDELLHSGSLVRIAGHILQEQLLPEKQLEIFLSSFRIYEGTTPLTSSELGRKMDLTERSIRKSRKIILGKILEKLPSLEKVPEDLSQIYGLDLKSPLIIVDEALAEQVNLEAGTNFTPQFLGLLFGIFLEKHYTTLGKVEEVLAGNYLGIRHFWSSFYLLRKDLAGALDHEALLVESFRLKNSGETRSLNFKTFVSHFIRSSRRAEVDVFQPAAAEILLRELGLQVKKEKLLFPPRKPFLLCGYAKDALKILGKPSRLEVIRQQVEELHPGVAVDTIRFDLVLLDKWGFTSHKGLYGLKKWFGGKLKHQDPALLEELTEELPPRTGAYWKLHWDQKFSELNAFTDAHNRLPEEDGSAEEKTLNSWLKRQMQNYAKGKLDTHQLEQYKEFRKRFPLRAGRTFSNALWESRYEELKEFASLHSKPPRKTGPGEEGVLYKWLIVQKIRINKGELDQRKKTLIRDFEFRHPLRKPKIVKEEDFQRLIRFTEIHSRLPAQNATDEEEKALNYFWLKQLEKMKQGKLVRHRETLLKNLKRKYPYNSTQKKAAWFKRLEELNSYTEAHGLPTGHKCTGLAKTLRGWLIIQRVRMNKGELNPQQEKLLREFDELYLEKPDWEALWDRRFQELQDFAIVHSRFPKQEVEAEATLYRWLMTQRHQMKKDELAAGQKERLMELMQEYPVKSLVYQRVLWYEKFEELQAFADANSRLPLSNRREEQVLYKWFHTQKNRGIRGKLDSIQRSRIRELVEKYPPRKEYEEHWQARFQELQRFIELKSRLPKSKAPKKENSLYSWFRQQQKRREEGKLEPQQAVLIKNLANRYSRKGPDWFDRLEEVKEFAEKNLRIPKRTAPDEEERALNRWFLGQKERLRKGRLDEWQAKRVQELVNRYGTGPGRSKPKVEEVLEVEED